MVRRNLDLLAALPREIVAAGLPVAALVLVIPTAAPMPGECASLAEIAAAITAVADAARRVGLAVRLDPTTYVPPCIFEKPERVAHLFALNRGNADAPRLRARGGLRARAWSTIAARACRAPRWRPATRRRCSPITEHRLRRRLTVVSSVEEQMARELVDPRRAAAAAHEPVPEYTVRVNFHCNQACEFCFVSTHLPPAAEAAVRAGDRDRRPRARRAGAVRRRADA